MLTCFPKLGNKQRSMNRAWICATIQTLDDPQGLALEINSHKSLICDNFLSTHRKVKITWIVIIKMQANPAPAQSATSHFLPLSTPSLILIHKMKMSEITKHAGVSPRNLIHETYWGPLVVESGHGEHLEHYCYK